MARKKNTKVSNEVSNEVINIVASEELRQNVGRLVKTPNGQSFKVLLWETAKEHGLNSESSKYGSRLKIEYNGKVREFFNSSYNGSEKLSNFYEEVGLKTSGKGGDGERTKRFEVKNLNMATDEQLQQFISECSKILNERKEERENNDLLKLFNGLTAEQKRALLNNM